MSIPFDNPEYPSTTPEADTLTDSVLMLLALTVVQRLVGFGRAVLFCRWLPAEQLGLWDMTFSFLVVASPVAVMAIPGAFGRYLEYYRQRGQLATFLRQTSIACASLAVVACVVIALTRHQVSAMLFGTTDQAGLIALTAGCLAVVVVYNFCIELFTAMRNIRLVSAVQLTNSVVFAVLGVGLLLCWQPSAESVLLSYGGSCVTAAAVGVWCLVRLRRRSRTASRQPRPSDGHSPHLAHPTVWRKVLPFASWLLLACVLTNLFEVVDRYMIIHFSGSSAGRPLDLVGNYHASRLVPMLLVSLATMLATMITPHLSHDWESGHRQQAAARLRLFLKTVGLALWALAVAVLIAAPLLFKFALKDKYPGGLAVLPWTLVYCSWFSLWVIGQNYFFCAEKARLASVSLAVGLVANVLLNIMLLPRYGLMGAVWATAAANALSLWLLCRFNHRLGFRLDFGARLVLALPLVLCLGPWVAGLTLIVVAAEVIWGNRLLREEEKSQLGEGIADLVRRAGLERWLPESRRAVGR
ncbi:MAG: lipopolysaccharide biosynthesis protein [Thermoguttaceae bacterium]